jgi:MYXO-CTERM domain-containing protein
MSVSSLIDAARPTTGGQRRPSMPLLARAALLLGLLAGLASATSAEAQQLGFTLSSDLKKAGCAADDDGDCLDNFLEAELAFMVAPHYFYDEDEGCSGAPYLGNANPLHYGRKDFFQVRPLNANVSAWQPNDGVVKTVQITYFLLHPHDCQSHLGFGGHQGDSEHVRFRLQSTDLRSWALTLGEYHHHSRVDNFSGAYLASRASEIGTVYPSIAADEDGHGSWPGRVGSSSHCAGSQDDFCLSSCDCFVGSMASALANGKWEYLATDRNVGGPSPEQFRPSAVTVSGGHAFSTFSVGHGNNVEYWTARTDSFKKFCGWECSSRNSDGDCNTSVHSETGCVSPLSSKVDTTSFVAGAAAGLAQAVEPEASAREPVDATPVLDAISALPGLRDEDRGQLALAVEQSEDPVGLLVPMVAGWPRDRQLAFLRHIDGLPLGKAESVVSLELLPARALDGEGRRQDAAMVLDALRESLGNESFAAASAFDDGPAVEPAAGCLVTPGAAPSAGPWILLALIGLVVAGLRRRSSR